MSLYKDSDCQREREAEVRESTGPESYRSSFRRDYARLIHSAAFRRLQGKTQVFPGGESDFFRNRLTHSLEVAQISKSLAIKFNSESEYFRKNPIDTDLVEFAGLAHDIGHPPFGHNGEAALDQFMRESGGFEGNGQTFRIMCRTEKKEVDQDFPTPVLPDGTDNRLGLNLCYRSLAAILKYDRVIPDNRDEGEPVVKGIYPSEEKIYRHTREAVASGTPRGKFKTIECSIMDIADDIAYSTYDLEDTFKAEFLDPLEVLTASDPIRSRVADKIDKAVNKRISDANVLELFYDIFQGLSEGAKGVVCDGDGPYDQMTIAALVHRTSRELARSGYLRTKFTADLIREFISGIHVEVHENSPQLSKVVVDEPTLIKIEALKHFTYEATIMSPRLQIAEYRGADIVSRLFETLDSERGHRLLPEDFRALYRSFTNEANRQRTICDFIAGMTDRYAVEFYGRIFSENPESIFKLY